MPLIEQTVGSIRRTLLVLFGAVLFVLLIACANVANLLLARAATRQREVAVGATLGADRWRIVRQLLTESMLLSVVGGALGVLLARWGLQLLLYLSPANIPRLENIRLDGRALGFTVGLSLLTGLIFGLAPALQTSHLELGEMLKEGGRAGSGSPRAQRIRSAFIVAEVALTLSLLIGAGLLIRSFWRLQQVNPGFKTDHLLTLQLRLPRSKSPEDAQIVSFFDRLQERLSALPGVEAVSATSNILLPKLANAAGFIIENKPPGPRELRLELPYDAAQPNYFQTMGIQLLNGHAFTEQDTRDKPKVAIVNETFVKRYFPNEDPVGKRFKFGDENDNEQWITIIGVVRNTKRQGLDQSVRIESWLPLAQSPSRSMQVVLRTTGDPLALSQAVREAVWSLDRDLPIPKIETMEQILSESVAQRQLNMLLLGLFALMALVLAAVGIYGVVSYSVAQRTHEIGIRMALGAQPLNVLKLVIWQGMRLAIIGIALGIAGALMLTRLLRTLLFGVTATDPVMFGLAALLLASVVLMACYLPARRATKVDPMIALRRE